MTTQAITIDLPQEIYRRLQGMAQATQQLLEDILVQTIRGNLPPSVEDLPAVHDALLNTLLPLTDAVLWEVAHESLSAQDQCRQQRLLRKAQRAALTAAEQTEVTTLRLLTDQVVLRRSVAMALLKWRGYTLPAAP